MASAREPPALGLAVELEAAARLSGRVVLSNRGPSELRVWRPANSWGDPMLSFEFAGPSGVRLVARAPLRYTRNAPGAVAVPPGGEYAIPFDLQDGTWAPGVPTDATFLTAVLHIPDSPEALEHQVWTGRLRSDPVPLN